MIHKRFVDPPFSLKTIAQNFRGALFFSVLFSGLLLINIGQMMSLVILPFSRNAFRSANRFFANTWWSACVLTAQKLNHAKLIVSGDAVPQRENALVFVNHQQMSDILVIMFFAKTKGRLGDLKWFVKDILKYFPGVGWGMLFLDCLFVKRNWESDKNKIRSIFFKFKKDNIPLWLITFAEGTRINASKVKRSQKHALERKLPILNNVLLPRTKGFVASVEGLTDHTRVVYDFTIGYPNGVPSLWQIAKGTSKEFHFHVKRFNWDELPLEKPELAKWLVNRFEVKDALLEKFYQTGEFPKSVKNLSK